MVGICKNVSNLNLLGNGKRINLPTTMFFCEFYQFWISFYADFFLSFIGFVGFVRPKIEKPAFSFAAAAPDPLVTCSFRRWVRSSLFQCFQLPTPTGAGRPAIRSEIRNPVSLLCGLKRARRLRRKRKSGRLCVFAPIQSLGEINTLPGSAPLVPVPRNNFPAFRRRFEKPPAKGLRLLW